MKHLQKDSLGSLTRRLRAWHIGRNLWSDDSLLRSSILTFLRKAARQPVRYRYFSMLSTGDFDQYVGERTKTPTKLCALDWLSKERLLNNTLTLLDIGCGPGVMARMIANHPTLKDRVVYTGIDQSESALSYARKISPQRYQFIQRDVLGEGVPEQYHDVIMLNEIVEHMPGYEAIIDMSVVKKPKVLILTAFAIEPSERQDRIRWNSENECYMNYYAFQRVHQKLRGIAANRPLYIADFGTSESSANPWFPRKTHTVFYLPLAAPVVIERNSAYAPYLVNQEDAKHFWGENYEAAK
jgi:ubiquinone/menaquinone biosynthesis C-methylase UbiE